MKPRFFLILCLLLPLLQISAEHVLLPRDSRLVNSPTAMFFNILLRVDPEGNVYGLSDNSCIRFADSTLLFSLPPEICVRDMQCIGEDKFLLAVDSTIVFYRHGEDIPHLLCYADAPITAFWADSTGCITASGRKLTFYTNDGNKCLLHQATDTLTALVQSDEGLLFYGTQSSLYVLDSTLHAIPVIDKGVRHLAAIENQLLISFIDSTEAVLTNIDGYVPLTDSICSLRGKLPITLENYTTTVLNDGDSADMRDMTFAVLPSHGLFAVIQNHFISMESQDSYPEYAFPDTTYAIDEVVFLPTIAVYKSFNNLLYVNEQQRTRGFAFDTDSFHIAQASDTSVYLLTKGAVWECNPRRPVPHIVTRTIPDEQVIRFMPLNQDTLVITEHVLYTISGSGPKLMLSLSTEITTAYAGPHGIWIGTKNGLYRFTKKEGLLQVAQMSVRQILNDGNSLYVISDNGTIYRLQGRIHKKNKPHKNR